MRTIFDHIEHIHGKPHHIRKRITFTAAGAGTILVALVWLIGNISTNRFAIAGSSFADSVGQENVITTGANAAGSSLLAGAAAAVPDAVTTTAPHIEIIDAGSSVSSQKKVEQTVIPF
ncbi:hypothetical protein KGM48_03850 [Patescibacteria group bacterium]|nr:hypothetical protein [Patescibacteria group bacterium]